MPVFRFHRGSLEDSMKTCFVVNDKKDLFDKVCDFNKVTNAPSTEDDGIWIRSSVRNIDHIRIDPYMFDDRIGWNTHIVTVHSECVTQDPYVLGFLSDGFRENNHDKPI